MISWNHCITEKGDRTDCNVGGWSSKDEESWQWLANFFNPIFL